MNIRSKFTHALVMILILALAGCTTSTIVTDLQVALDAISAALPILGSLTGVPANVVTAATSYVSAANTALGQSSTILDGPGTDAEKAAAIAAAFAGIAVPVVPVQYAAIAQLIQTVAADVAAFLATVPAGSPAQMKLAAKSAHVTKWSIDDRLRLAHAHAVANDNEKRLEKLRVK